MNNDFKEFQKHRTKGEWYVSHSPVVKSTLSDKVFKSVKTTKGIGGHIIANCFSTGPNSIMKAKEAIAEAEANAAFVVKACNKYEILTKGLSDLKTIIEHNFPDLSENEDSIQYEMLKKIGSLLSN